MLNAKQALLFDDLGPRRVQADFSGGHLSSDGGVLLLRQVDHGLGVIRSLAACFADGRDQRFVDHELEPLLAQRVYGLALGYEDLNDHDRLRLDPLFLPVIRKRCPRARILVRGDSGFCREEIMSYCEEQKIHYVLGLARNPTLVKHLAEAFFWLEARQCLSAASNLRSFVEFEYQTRETWTRARRVIGKAEMTSGNRNPRFVVTNLAGGWDARAIYEEIYCGRCNMENILKQPVLDLEADRMSTHYLASNQLRLWLATFAYLLVERLRAFGLASTELASATVGTIRTQLLKVAASVQVSVRRVYVRFCSAFPRQALFRHCLEALKIRTSLTG